MDLLRPLCRDEQVEAELAALGRNPDGMFRDERGDGDPPASAGRRCAPRRSRRVRARDRCAAATALRGRPPQRQLAPRASTTSRDRRRDSGRRGARHRRRASPAGRAPRAASVERRDSRLEGEAPARAALLTSPTLRRLCPPRATRPRVRTPHVRPPDRAATRQRGRSGRAARSRAGARFRRS